MISSGDSKRRVAVFAPLFPPAFRGGGPIRSIEAMVSQCPQDIGPWVLTSSRDLGEQAPLDVEVDVWSDYGLARVMYASTNSPRLLFRALRALRRSRPHLVHLNSFFHPIMSILPLALWVAGFWGRVPLLLSPRGEFGDGAMRHRPWKKAPYLLFFRLLGLHRRVIWHSTAPHETAAIRQRWGSGIQLVERQNDTLLPSSARHTHRNDDGPLRAVFLGRIVEHKGLAIALEALRDVGGAIEFNVFGSREDEDYAARCEELAREVAESVTVQFHGAVTPGEVAGIMADHDVLLMPTAGENFGHVIAEALSESCAVVTTPETPWTEVLAGGGGLVVRREVAAWATAIAGLAQDDRERREARRSSAGEAYNRWVSRPRESHVWSTALGVTSTQPGS